MNKEELLKLVEEFVKSEPSKQWRPGKDHVHYAGPYFDQNEIVRSVSTLLDSVHAKTENAERTLIVSLQIKNLMSYFFE